MSSIQKVAACLHKLAQKVEPEEVFQAEQAKLAEDAGLSLRSTQRVLDELRQQGVIEGARGRYRVLDATKLASAAMGAVVEEGEIRHTPKRHASTPKKSDMPTQRDMPTRHATEERDVSELVRLRAEVATLSSELVSLRAQGASFVEQIVGALDALRLEMTALRDMTRQNNNMPSANMTCQSDMPLSNDKSRGEGEVVDAGNAKAKVEAVNVQSVSEALMDDHDDLIALQQLVSLAVDKRGKAGSPSAAALLLKITEGRVRHMLRSKRVDPDLAVRVRAVLASLDAQSSAGA